MGENISDRLWKDLTPEQVDWFFRQFAARADAYGKSAQSAWAELAKYLFAANTGAAAGMFILLKSSEGQNWYFAAFSVFCAGTFFVGLSYFLYANWSSELSEEWSADMNSWGRNEISIRQMDTRNRQRLCSWKRKVARIGLVISFLLLIAGGLTAVKPLFGKNSIVQQGHSVFKP
jgi:hypothetical protein